MTTPDRPAKRSSPGLRPIEGRDVSSLAPVRDEYDIYAGDLDGGDGYGDAPGDRIRRAAGHQLVRAGWLVLAAGLAFGSAGVVSATQHSPAGGNRPELTWAADNQLSAELDAAIRELVLLNDDVDQLGQMARNALAGLAQVNQAGLSAAWAGGSSAVDAIDAHSADLASRLACESLNTARLLELSKTYSPEPIARYRSVCAAVASIAPLRDDWEALVAGSQVAMQVASDINSHDQVATGALQLATAGRYPDALAELTGASRSIADAKSIADELATVTDVSTLQDWLTRTTAMDDALGILWQSMIDSKGRITPQVTAALKGVTDAQALLPDDNSVMQVVLYELAGNLIPDGISIETARGALSAAIGDLTGGTVVGK
jgi:hypothetical protein